MKNLKILIALLAAFALIFAVGCPNDGSDEVYSDLEDDNGSSTEDGSTSSEDTSGDNGGSATSTDAGGHTLVDDPSANGVGYVIENGTYSVYTAAGLQAWAKAIEDNSNYAISATLYNCIDLSDVDWTPVDTDSSSAYNGTFEGGGHVISNLKIETSDNYAGFFGFIASGGTVKNLGLESVSVTVNGTNSCAGGIAGEIRSGTITACYWSNEDVEEGVGSGSGSATQVDPTGKTEGAEDSWIDAQTAMNSAFNTSSVGWKYDGATKTTPPTLKKS